MDQSLAELGRFLSYVLTAIVAGVTAYFARRKAKEDSNLSTIGQAIDVWKSLAESNKDHWDECEKKTDELELKMQEMNVLILEQRSQINLLQFKLERLETKDDR